MSVHVKLFGRGLIIDPLGADIKDVFVKSTFPWAGIGLVIEPLGA
jgi:hypothetical protein